MGLRRPEEYIQAIKTRRKAEIYVLGEQVEDVTEHPFLKPTVKAYAATYEAAWDPALKDLARAYSPYINEEVNRFNHIHQSREDLEAKVKLLRALSHKVGACVQRCVGWDAINALHIVTHMIDRKKGTEYHKRFLEFLKYVQKNDIALAGVMTDVKGVRALRPHQQPNPDAYVRVVEVRDDGIVVRGAKMSITGVVTSEELIVMPTRAMTEKDADYAISFAVPLDTEGIKIIVGRQVNDCRRFEDNEIDSLPGAFNHEAMIIFDDVFVPWERVFMFREWEYAYPLVEIFSSYHRHAYGGCKSGLADVIIGAAYNLAKQMGIADKHHIREKLVEMVFLTEAMYAASIAASWRGKRMGSGCYWVDPMFSNVAKQLVTRFPYEIARLSHDIAGGALGTAPSAKDFANPKLRPLLEKYFQCLPDYPAEHRLRMLRLLENISLGVMFLIESLHGAGSPAAQRIMMSRLYDFEKAEKIAKYLARIEKELPEDVRGKPEPWRRDIEEE